MKSPLEGPACQVHLIASPPAVERPACEAGGVRGAVIGRDKHAHPFG